MRQPEESNTTRSLRLIQFYRPSLPYLQATLVSSGTHWFPPFIRFVMLDTLLLCCIITMRVTTKKSERLWVLVPDVILNIFSRKPIWLKLVPQHPTHHAMVHITLHTTSALKWGWRWLTRHCPCRWLLFSLLSSSSSSSPSLLLLLLLLS